MGPLLIGALLCTLAFLWVFTWAFPFTCRIRVAACLWLNGTGLRVFLLLDCRGGQVARGKVTLIVNLIGFLALWRKMVQRAFDLLPYLF